MAKSRVDQWAMGEEQEETTGEQAKTFKRINRRKEDLEEGDRLGYRVLSRREKEKFGCERGQAQRKQT